ncbi:MAG TPA: hypothetical protein VMA83_00515 [Solirubrobacteraceae bacterium]|nr:hypothetical protein [Solirubrobacteraceae bacterium]
MDDEAREARDVDDPHDQRRVAGPDPDPEADGEHEACGVGAVSGPTGAWLASDVHHHHIIGVIPLSLKSAARLRTRIPEGMAR